MAQWTPRGADPSAHHVLVDGVPQYMHESLKAWVVKQLQFYQNYSTHFRVELMREYDLDLKGPYSMADTLEDVGPATMFDAMDDDQRLDLVDWLAHRLPPFRGSPNDLIRELDTILTRGSSMWAVGDRNGNPGLVRRVPEGVQAGTEAVIASSASAGSLLGQAWSALYGRNPDPEEAYEKAIKAVEEAGASIVSPNNSRATLGTMIADMRNQVDWKLPLDSAQAAVTLPMAEALWQGQQSRHGGNGYRPPTLEEAESAVLLAVPLVQWFTSGVLQRRP